MIRLFRAVVKAVKIIYLLAYAMYSMFRELYRDIRDLDVDAEIKEAKLLGEE